MINLKNNTVNLDFFKTIIKEIKNADQVGPNERKNLLDSYSFNQFKSKTKLFELIELLDAINKNSTVVIFGSWYGSILIPVLSPLVFKILAVDIDTNALSIGQHRLFKNLNNIEWINNDVFKFWSDDYLTADLFINTSCEHMPPMKDWPWWDTVRDGAYFAFQTNNMFNIDGHINCVQSLEDFRSQLPLNFKILFENNLDDERGTRYTIVGKIKKNKT